jgi:hypothetical protein
MPAAFRNSLQRIQFFTGWLRRLFASMLEATTYKACLKVKVHDVKKI